MALPMTRPIKHPKTGIFMLRKRVPDELRSVLGKREEKLSLGTRDPQEAKRLHAEALAKLESRWANLRLPEKPLSWPEIQACVASFAGEYLAEFAGIPPGISLKRCWPIEAAAIAPDEWMGLSSDRSDEQRRERVGALLQQYTAKAGLRIPTETTTQLVEKLSTALDELAPAIRFRGVDGCFPSLAPGKPISSLITSEWQQLGTPQASIVPVASSRQSPDASRATVSLGQLFRDWAAEKSPREKTRYSWERVTKELASFLGHDDASRISAEDLIRWKAALLAMGRATKTIRDGKLAPIRAILQWGVDNRRLAKNAGERVTIDLRTKQADRKRGYTEDEARTVLMAALREKDMLRKWVPVLCAYTGARVSEVCQLRTQDVVQDEGVWCVKFVPEAGELKNVSSERSVPLHPWVVEQGFLEFVHRAKSGPLFPNVTPDRFGARGGNGTKIIGRWVRALGIKDHRVSPNHSWRHRFRTLGRRHALALDILDAITGHRRAAVADTYGGFPVEGLYREICKIPTIKLE